MTHIGEGDSMLREELQKRLMGAIEKVGMEERAGELLEAARECAQMSYVRPKEAMAVGATKVGGLPDLPASVEWPDGLDEEGGACGKAEFLAQFDLAGIPALAGFDMPREGHLWIFVRNTFRTAMPTVVIYSAERKLARREKPKSDDREPEYAWRDVKEAGLQFGLGVSLPLSSRVFAAKFDREDLRDLGELLAPGMNSYGGRTVDGQIGGYSYQAEVDLYRQYALYEMGEDTYTRADYWRSVAEFDEQHRRAIERAKDEERRDQKVKKMNELRPMVEWVMAHDGEIQRRADAFQLLCSFRPNDYIDLDLGSGMYMDFFMDREALGRRDFSKVYGVCPMLL